MTLMPGALWRPITRNYTPRKRARTNALILHIAASEATTLHGWFNNPDARASSHLYVRRDGTIEQYVDLDHTTWANKAGDARAVTVETQGMGHGKWTGAQLDALARIAAFVHQKYGVPLDPMHDSRTSTAGVGYHRLGVDPWRTVDGESWSGAYGKICPGPDRIAQVPTVISRARKLTTTTTSITSPEEDDIMATLDQLRQLIREEVGRAVWNHEFGPAHSPANGTEIPAETAGARLREVRKAATYTNQVAAQHDTTRKEA